MDLQVKTFNNWVHEEIKELFLPRRLYYGTGVDATATDIVE